MRTRNKLIIGAGAAVVLTAAVHFSLQSGRQGGIGARIEVVEERDLTATVTASGNVRARRKVDISSDISARVTELLTDEGEEVVEGQVLLRLDPTRYQASVNRSMATLKQTQAQVAQVRANYLRAEREANRRRSLWQTDSLLVSRQEVENAESDLEVQASLLESAEFGVGQARAALEEAEDQLAKTIIRAPMSGRVTRLNVEAGETVIVGTMNNPGSLVLTVSDLSVMEVVLEVDDDGRSRHLGRGQRDGRAGRLSRRVGVRRRGHRDRQQRDSPAVAGGGDGADSNDRLRGRRDASVAARRAAPRPLRHRAGRRRVARGPAEHSDHLADSPRGGGYREEGGRQRQRRGSRGQHGRGRTLGPRRGGVRGQGGAGALRAGRGWHRRSGALRGPLRDLAWGHRGERTLPGGAHTEEWHAHRADWRTHLAPVLGPASRRNRQCDRRTARRAPPGGDPACVGADHHAAAQEPVHAPGCHRRRDVPGRGGQHRGGGWTATFATRSPRESRASTQ